MKGDVDDSLLLVEEENDNISEVAAAAANHHQHHLQEPDMYTFNTGGKNNKIHNNYNEEVS